MIQQLRFKDSQLAATSRNRRVEASGDLLQRRGKGHRPTAGNRHVRLAKQTGIRSNEADRKRLGAKL